MLVRYASRTGEVKVLGTRDDLHHLASLVKAGRGEVPCCEDNTPGPYNKTLSTVTIFNTPGRNVVLSVTDRGTLLIDGDMTKLSVFAKNISGFAEAAGAQEHMHVEYFPGHFYLGPESAPVVFAFT